MTWTQHDASDACAPWLLTLRGDAARPASATSSRKRRRRKGAAAEAAVSLFVYAIAPDGELYVRSAAATDPEAATPAGEGDGEAAAGTARGSVVDAAAMGPLASIAGYRKDGARGGAASGGFALLAWAPLLSVDTDSLPAVDAAPAAQGAADAAPSPAKKARKAPQAAPLFARTHLLDMTGDAAAARRAGSSSGGGIAGTGASAVAHLPEAEFLRRAWRSAAVRQAPEEAWRVEEVVQRELRRSAAAAERDARAASAAAWHRESSVRAGAQDAPEGSAARREAEAVAAESAELKAELELPLLPVLNNSAPDRGNVAVLQLVVTLPFELQLVFLQQECFSSAGASSSVPSERTGAPVNSAGTSKATTVGDSDGLQSQGRQLEPALAAAFAKAAADPIRRIKTRTWRQLAESLGFSSLDSTHSIAEARRRQYHEDLCARLRICVDSAHPQQASGNSTATGGEASDHGHVAGPAAAAQRNRSAEAITPQLVASRAIANLVGSITHFHGPQLVADAFPLDGDTGRTLPAARQTAPGHLLSGVPSRSFFPRGFLWDEGFHQLIVSQVNAPLSRRVLRSWLHSMEADGWIPREQILGGEARSRVPERFRVQHRDIANPPAIVLPVLALAADTFCRRPPHAWTAQATRDASAAPPAAATPAGDGAAVEAGGGGPAAEVVAEVLVLPGGEVAATLPDGVAVNNGSTAGMTPHVSVTLAPFLPAGVLRFCESRYLHLQPSQQVVREGGGATGGTGVQRCKYACSLPEVAPAAHGVSAGTSAGRHADALGLEEDAADAADDDAAALAAASDDDDDGLADDLVETDRGAAHRRSVHAQVQRALSFYRMAYRRLSVHYAWMRRSQAGAQPGSFRWRGATQDHNFASGLDDYPRGDVPTAADENVDLLAWIAFFGEALAELGGLVDAPAVEVATYRADAAAAVERLHSRHWSAEYKAFCDIGARVQPGRRAVGEPVPVAMGLLCHVGYVSLVPLMLRHVDPADGARLGALLSVMEDEGQLWSPYGLRSLSRASEHYATKEDYWRQAVWLNMNYLSVAALRYYAAASPDAAIAARAGALAGRLADTLVGTVVSEYAATGFLWENYDSRAGKGRGTHPFTGWTALVALMVADRYPV